MDRAADFFVEQRVPTVFADIVVGGNRRLAEVSGTAVHANHRPQERLAFAGFGFDDFAVLERQARPVDFPSAVHCRETERDVALDAGFDGAGEHLAVRKIVMTVAVDPGPPAHAVGQVGVLRHDPHPARAV